MVTLVFIKRALHIVMTNPGNLILLETAGLRPVRAVTLGSWCSLSSSSGFFAKLKSWVVFAPAFLDS